jgi:hypothetical protein
MKKERENYGFHYACFLSHFPDPGPKVKEVIAVIAVI